MDLVKKLIFALLVLASASLAAAGPRLTIHPGPVALTDFRMGYHVDTSEELTYQQVRHLPFSETGSRTSLGTSARVTWFRLVLNNAGDVERTLFVHLPHAYHARSVDFYEERSGELLRHELLDLNQADVSKRLYGGTAVYEVNLTATEPTVLYIRSHSFSHQWFAVEILDEQASRQALVSISAHLPGALHDGDI